MIHKGRNHDNCPTLHKIKADDECPDCGIDKNCPKKLAHKRRLRYVNVEMMDEVEGAWRKRRDEERGIV